MFGLFLCSVLLYCLSFCSSKANHMPRLSIRSKIVHATDNVEVTGVSLNGMILVERLGDPEFSESGIFRSRSKEPIRRFLAKVAALPADGFTNENGFNNPLETLCPYKVGDLVFVDVSTLYCFMQLTNVCSYQNFNAVTSEFRGPGPKGKLYSYHRPWYIRAAVRNPENNE